MDKIRFSYQETALVSPATIASLLARLSPEITRVSSAWDGGYHSPYGAIQLPLDTTMHAAVLELVQEKKKLNPSSMIVIGIGGSNLGTIAVYDALGALSSIKPFFADSVDSYFTAQLYAHAQQELEQGREILLVIISKSGSTTETVANAQLFTDLLKKYRPTYKDYLVIISDDGSKLSTLGITNGISCLTIPATVGGRYSVLSAVGLFPLAMLCVDITELCAGAASVQELTKNYDSDMAALAASIVYVHATNGAAIYDHFFFASRLNSLGLWMRQLLAESIGKADNLKGERVNAGIAPTVSIGSADLHSVAQLYLGGPNNRITAFVSTKEQEHITVPSDGLFTSLVPDIGGKKYGQIMDAISAGTKKAYMHERRAFFNLELPAITPYYIGQFMQYAIIQTIYLGHLFEINPFDQPQVELYKKETRKMLANE